MSIERRLRQQMLQYCLEVHDDDGEDARQILRKKGPRNKVDYKTRQLCRQVLEALSLTIADSRDERLAEIQILAVEPAPDASRLRVIVAAAGVPDGADSAEFLGCLRDHAARLRCDVAAAITRRKAPHLIFHWRPVNEVPEVQS